MDTTDSDPHKDANAGGHASGERSADLFAVHDFDIKIDLDVPASCK